MPERVIIDLRYCRFVNPPAALWCLIYCSLVAKGGQECELLVPEDTGVARYLKALRLFDLLQECGVAVDDRGVEPGRTIQIAAPITRFKNLNDVDSIANDALDALRRQNLGAGNIRPIVVEAFAELANNAVEHSNSSIDCFGMIQHLPLDSGRRFVCAVADGGIGIRRSLEGNPELKARVFYDWIAIELALKERISGTGLPTRGMGLYGISEDMRKPGRSILVHSGLGIVRRSEDLETDSRRGPLFPGTLAYAAIPA